MPPFKRSAVKKLHHPYSRREKTSQVERKRNVFTSDHRERLHPPLHKATVDKQVRLPEFGEDVPASFHYAVARKKRLRLLSKVVPDGTVK